MTDTFVDLSGGVTRLNAQDGLFLRAHHLNEMEDYAQKLATLVAQGGGPGVVYGYDLTLTLADSKLHITPGLAIDHTGMPLVSDQGATLDLTNLKHVLNTYWRIDLVPGAQVASADENVYGSACDDACNGGTIQSDLTQGARVQLTLQTLDNLDSHVAKDQRNWIAAQLFEAERVDSGPWLRSGDGLNSHPWQTGTPLPTEPNLVPLGVLWNGTGGLQLDQWIARRELVETPARRLWQSRLGMRPDSVFLAQISQFQAQLSDVLGNPVPASSIAQVVQWLDSARAGVTRHDETAPVALLTSAISALSGTAPTGTAPLTLPDRGINDLPPAGYLPLIVSEGGLEQAVRNLFGPSDVDLGFTYCSADFVAEHVQRAQHRDRIPLQNTIRTPVEVFVPEDGSLGWVAFTRSSRPSSRDTSSGGEAVPVYYTTTGPGVHPDKAATGVIGDLVGLIGTVHFPVNGWASPESGVYQRVQQLISEAVKDKEVVVVGVANSEDRLPLAAVRATLLGTSFTPNPQIPEIQAVLAPNEAIVLVISTPAPSGGK